MSQQVLSSDPELTETEPRPHKRRRKTITDHIVTAGSLAGAIAAITVLTGSITDALPFVQKTPYANDWAANDVRMIQAETQVRALNDNVQSLVTTGEMSLQLQLQQRVEALQETLRTMPNSPTRDAIKATYDDLNQRLIALNRKINR